MKGLAVVTMAMRVAQRTSVRDALDATEPQLGGLTLLVNNAAIAGEAAVHQMSKVMALELAAHHMRVNAVAPGYIRTDLVDELMGAGTPDDIAAAVSWLASDESRYVAGEVLAVDGGWLAFGRVGPASTA